MICSTVSIFLIPVCASAAGGKFRVSPELGNVFFACTQTGWSFSLTSFARLYSQTYNVQFETVEFAKRLWGDYYFNPSTRQFTNRSEAKGTPRAFVHFVLEPLYKVYAAVVGEPGPVLQSVLAEIGIFLRKEQYNQNIKTMLKNVLDQFFGDSEGFTDAIARHIPSAQAGTLRKVQMTYSGPSEADLTESMGQCHSDGPLVIQVSKLYPTMDATAFRAFGRILSGTVKIGDKVRVLGENYSLDDEEDMAVAQVSELAVFESRYSIQIPHASAGNWVLIGGIDASIFKTATVVGMNVAEAHILKPLKFNNQPVMKIAIEPLNPSELPKMVDGLRKINKSYPLVVTRVEESGEHIVLGPGELYLDCVMYDLRVLFSEIEIKVSDPVVSFCETVTETSSLKCFAETPNKKNKLTMIAEPLEKGIAEDIENGVVDVRWPKKKLAEFFQNKYGWDVLAARNIWAFGPDDHGPNVLIDDTLTGEVDKTLLNAIRDSIRQGFQWSAREGPLCDERMSPSCCVLAVFV